MKRVYLTETLPETTKIQNSMPADIRRNLESYEETKNDLKNAASLLRPMPLEKYNVTKDQQIVTQKERMDLLGRDHALEQDAPSLIFPDTLKKFKVESLPKVGWAKARKLLPHLEKMDLSAVDNVKDLIYDLTVPNVKKLRSQNREVLAGIYRQLDSDTMVPKRLYIKKFDLYKLEETPHVSSSGKPSRARKVKSTPIKQKYFTQANLTPSTWI